MSEFKSEICQEKSDAAVLSLFLWEREFEVCRAQAEK